MVGKNKKIKVLREIPRELKEIKKEMGCGEVSISKDQARVSVQKIKDISETVVPFFRKNTLTDNKKKDFELWAKGVEIIQRNKGKYLAGWKKNDICTLIEIHNSSAKYKKNARSPKWLDMAKSLSKIQSVVYLVLDTLIARLKP